MRIIILLLMWLLLKIIKNKRKKLTRRQYDQKKVKRCIAANPNFILDMLSDAFSDVDSPVNLYGAFSGLRTQAKFLDLATVRYLVGNGLVKAVDMDQDKKFVFHEQLYRLTKKGAKIILSNEEKGKAAT